MKILRAVLVISGLGFLACRPLDAAPSRIVVVVNKDAITAAEIEERIRLMNLGAGKPVTSPVSEDVRKKITQGMIEECLQLQAAKAKKILIDEAEVEKAVETLAHDNKMTLQGMLAMLKSNGISKQTMMARIRAQMAWGRYIREMYAPLVHISDQEVDKTLSQMKEIKPEEPPIEMMDITLCQAIFPVTPDTGEDVMAILGPKIEETHQAKGCAAFLKAAQGGGAKVEANRVVKLGQLPEALKATVQKAKAGNCLQPAMTPEGLVLTMVCSKTMPKAAPMPSLTRETAFQAKEQEILGKKAAQEMAKLKSVAFIEYK